MSTESDAHEDDIVIFGGGPAGMTATLYSTRLGHKMPVDDVYAVATVHPATIRCRLRSGRKPKP